MVYIIQFNRYSTVAIASLLDSQFQLAYGCTEFYTYLERAAR